LQPSRVVSPYTSPGEIRFHTMYSRRLLSSPAAGVAATSHNDPQQLPFTTLHEPRVYLSWLQHQGATVCLTKNLLKLCLRYSLVKFASLSVGKRFTSSCKCTLCFYQASLS
jgi:hypothetical protein